MIFSEPPGYDWCFLVLNREETRLLTIYPFAPSYGENSLQAYYFHVGRRTVKPIYYEWLEKNIGLYGRDWYINRRTPYEHDIMFRKKTDAMRFKLTMV